MSSLLRVEHVTISYNGKPVVQDVNFELKQGEILGIVGESGSGKSTIIKAIMGLLGEEGLVTKGDIWYKGENLTDMSTKELRRYLGKEIGMVFQDCKSALCPVRKIGVQIHEAVSEHEKASRHEVRNRAGEIMKKIGLNDADRVLDSYPFELSGGNGAETGGGRAFVYAGRIQHSDDSCNPQYRCGEDDGRPGSGASEWACQRVWGDEKRSGKSTGFVYKEADGICAETEKVRDVDMPGLL